MATLTNSTRTSATKLWKLSLGAGVNAPLGTDTVHGQYVAVAAGGNFRMGFPYSDSIALFRLPR